VFLELLRELLIDPVVDLLGDFRSRRLDVRRMCVLSARGICSLGEAIVGLVGWQEEDRKLWLSYSDQFVSDQRW
jgi:hypothetical protein